MAPDLAFIAALLRVDILEISRGVTAQPSTMDAYRAGAIGAARSGRRYQRRVRVKRT